VSDSKKDYISTWTVITAITSKIGCTSETLRAWHNKLKTKRYNALMKLFLKLLLLSRRKS
ncbi:hypothetical protein, partial [Acinetobacter bereziniae]|uniref:hypothetical protein n=1 Tax=Acinetobacter bereziniae TaxID=106648 RepID=UPI0038791DD1